MHYSFSMSLSLSPIIMMMACYHNQLNILNLQSSQNLFSAAGQLSGRLQIFAGQNPMFYIIEILEIFARHLSDRIKYFVSQNEILLVLTDRPALSVKTEYAKPKP